MAVGGVSGRVSARCGCDGRGGCHAAICQWGLFGFRAWVAVVALMATVARVLLPVLVWVINLFLFPTLQKGFPNCKIGA